jgi:KDO2-lipid IV(A) lauroyltransferase
LSSPTLRHRLEYGLYRAAEGLVRGLPYPTVLALGRGLGRAFWLLDARHRRVVRENLREAGIELTEPEVRRLSRDCFAHFGGLLLGTLRLMPMDEEELDRWVKVEGLEHFDAAARGGRGFIQLTGHYGNWEAVALAQSRHGRSLAVIARELDNPLLEPELAALRTRFGNIVISKDGAMRDTLKALKAGRGVGFLLDQDALTLGVFVKFLGRWASTFATAGSLAARYRLPVLPVFSWPNEDDTVTVRFEPPFQVPATGDAGRDAWAATQMMASRIEAQIRKDPRWWFWMHRRFKTRPGEGDPLPAPLPPPEWLESLAAFS